MSNYQKILIISIFVLILLFIGLREEGFKTASYIISSIIGLLSSQIYNSKSK